MIARQMKKATQSISKEEEKCKCLSTYVCSGHQVCLSCVHERFPVDRCVGNIIVNILFRFVDQRIRAFWRIEWMYRRYFVQRFVIAINIHSAIVLAQHFSQSQFVEIKNKLEASKYGVNFSPLCIFSHSFFVRLQFTHFSAITAIGFAVVAVATEYVNT